MEEPLPLATPKPARADVVARPPETTGVEPTVEHPIQVLIVDDISDTREGLSKLVMFEKDITVVGTARTGREGIEAARELQPDIVLMDINMPDIDGVKAAETITREVPQAQLIMMSVQSDSDYLRRSMLAGARDFLIKPFSADDLISTIHRVYQLGATRPQPGAQPAATAGPAPAAKASGAARRAQIIVVFSPQSGAGCTTLATNLAVAIRQAGAQKVALVDGHLQFGDVGLYLNLQSGKSIADLASMVEDLDPDFVEDVMLPHSSGIRVLLAPPRPELADAITPDALRRVLTIMSDVFDVIVIDSWAFLQETTLVFFELCDRLVLIATQEIPTVKNVKLFMDALDSLQFPPSRVSLVLNRVDPRAGIDPLDIERSIQHPLVGQIAANWRLATYAANRGMPFMISHKDSNLAQGISALASVLMAPAGAPAAAEAAASG
jgi:pilus assembly protein CpaE